MVRHGQWSSIVQDDSASQVTSADFQPDIVLDTPRYPNIVEGYAQTFERPKRLFGSFDVWVSAHARAFELHEKYEIGDQLSEP